VKYVAGLGTWLVWEHNRWVRQDLGGKTALARVVKKYLQELYKIARSKQPLYTLLNEPVSLEEAARWAKRSSSTGRIKAALDLAKDMPGVSISQADLDIDPYMLGVKNGVVDLRTGDLLPNDPKFLITRYARAAYFPDASAPLFERVVAEACLNRQGLIYCIQEIFGYCFSGLITEQEFYLFLGAGANSKTTLVNAVFHAMGDYAVGMPAHAFTRSESRTIRNDLARLPGVRFAACTEVNTGKSLDESTVKRITGGDIVTARFMGKDFFDFYPQAKFIFSVNTLPRVAGADNGIFRRLVVIPFDADFQDSMDTTLPAKLKEEVDGIFAWAVRGFTRWHERGYLEKPACVIEACKAYREDMDTVQAFINDSCDKDANSSTPLGTLYEEYNMWAKATMVEPANLHLFSTLMLQKGFRKHKSGCWRWKGIKLKQASAAPLVAGLFAAPAQATPADVTH